MDISSAILDPELGCVAFTVERITYTRSRSGTTARNSMLPALGCIHPGTPETLQLLPEETRAEEYIVVYTDFALSTGNNPGAAVYTAADRILWNGETWRVIRVRDWSGFGYVQALAVRMNDQPAVSS